MRRWAGVLLVVSLMTGLVPVHSSAAENEFETVFKNGFYGGLAGALVGGALLVFKDDPGDHLNYIGYGAAIGVIVGTTFGIVSATRSLAELDDHELVFHLPLPQTQIRSLTPTRREVVTSLDLLKVRF